MRVITADSNLISKIDGLEMLKSIETVGRTCYKSEDRITDDSCTQFVRSLIKRGHEAMIEHVSITVKFTCDRGVSHEVVRHRIASYAQESTRYCNYSKDKFGSGVTYIDIRKGIDNDLAMQKALAEGTLTAENVNLIINEWFLACEDAEKHYLRMIELGASPNIARSVLNNSTKTEINVTMNLREWRAFFKLRVADTAHPQMREVTIPLLQELNILVPVVFEDIVAAFVTDTLGDK